MTKVLIAYASMAGSTAEVAEVVGNTMNDHEIQIDVLPIREIQEIASYDAVIVGAPMIIGWHKEAMAFVETYQAFLSKVSVAYFITCVELTRPKEDSISPVPIYLDPNLGHTPTNPDKLSIKERRALPEGYLHVLLQNAPQVAPVSVAFFGGKIDYSRLKLFPRLFVKVVIRAEEGDRRNWPAIQTWAEDLGHFLDGAGEQQEREKMKIAILGSTGFLGKALLKRTLEAGYEIRTLVRDPDKLGEFKDRVEFVQGCISEVDKLEETVKGTEVVLSSVGPPQRNPGKPEFYERAMTDLVSVLEKQHIKRLIVTGGAAHLGGEKENWTLRRRLLRLFLLLVSKPILVAKQREWDVLKMSDLDWTLVRPPQIVEGEPTGNALADEKNLARTQVNVEDLANFMVEQITSTEWIRKAPLIASSRNS